MCLRTVFSLLFWYVKHLKSSTVDEDYRDYYKSQFWADLDTNDGGNVHLLTRNLRVSNFEGKFRCY